VSAVDPGWRLTWPQRRFYSAAATGFFNLQFLLPIVPLIAARHGSLAVAGLTTAIFMASAVLTQLAVPSLSRRVDFVGLLLSGSLLLGLPSFAYAINSSDATILAASVLRGVGFGIFSVVATATVIRMVTAEHRSQAIGRFGIVAGLMGALAPATAVRLYTAGFDSLVLIAAGCASTLGAGVMPVGLVRELPPGFDPPSVAGMLRRGELARPALVFALVMTGYGAVVSYVPASFPGSAALLLLVFGVTQAALRGLVGRIAQRPAGRALSVSATPAAFAGLLLLWSATSHHEAVMAGVGLVLLGAGSGTLATTCLATLASRGADRSHIGPAVLWNVGFDAGIAVGGLIVSAFASSHGTSTVNAICAALMLGAITVAWRDNRLAATSRASRSA
jgi:predicted MFS family arabinose efflux permease